MMNIKNLGQNMRIGKKILSIPLLAIISYVIIGVLFWFANQTTVQSLQRSQDVNHTVIHLEELNTILLESKADLLQALSWKLGYVKLDEVKKQLTKSLDLGHEIKKTLVENEEDFRSIGMTDETFQNLLVLIDEYNKSNKSSADMVVEDPETAIIMLNDTFGRFNDLQVVLKEYAEKAKEIDAQTLLALKSTLSSSFYSVAGAIAVSVLALLVIGSVIGGLIAKPIQDLTQIMTGLAGGDMAIEVSGTHRGDEVGHMAKAVEIFKQSIIKSNELQEEQRKSQKSDLERAEKLAEIVRAFEGKVTQVVAMFTQSSSEMTDAAGTLGVSVGTSERTTAIVEKASGQAMDNVQTVASAVQEMSASIQEISSQVSKTQMVIGSAVEKTQYADSETEKLSKSAEQIGTIVGLIQDIAEQTNLLALNATIEAARAGDAGKGFAVVASEVKELANQTAQATDQISQNIREVQGISTSVIQAIANIRESINEVSHYSSSVASAIEEQSSVTNDISCNMQSAADGVSEISRNMDEVMRAVAEVKNVADKILQTSGALSNHTTNLGQDVSTFCSDINAI